MTIEGSSARSKSALSFNNFNDKKDENKKFK